MKSRLFNIRCDNCGSEYRISSRGEMNCPFCGSKIYLNDADFKEYQKTRDEMLNRDRWANDEINNNGDVLNLWTDNNTIVFESETGKTINCSYTYYYEGKGKLKDIYVGRNKIAIVYNNPKDVQMFNANTNFVKYPSADIKGMSKFLPNVVFDTELKDGKMLVVYSKPENVYPLAITKNLDAKHVAWMISRMENLGCLLEFNNMCFNNVSLTDFYFNPKTHEIYLLDGWENVSIESNPTMLYLWRMRDYARQIMNLSTAPEMCIEFLNSKPAEDAYTDFKNWNEVIEHGFNGHNFHQFEM